MHDPVTGPKRPPLRHLREYVTGAVDAWRQRGELNCGRTYDDDPSSPRSDAYDRGANLGEALYRSTHAR